MGGGLERERESSTHNLGVGYHRQKGEKGLTERGESLWSSAVAVKKQSLCWTP